MCNSSFGVISQQFTVIGAADPDPRYPWPFPSLSLSTRKITCLHFFLEAYSVQNQAVLISWNCVQSVRYGLCCQPDDSNPLWINSHNFQVMQDLNLQHQVCISLETD